MKKIPLFSIAFLGLIVLGVALSPVLAVQGGVPAAPLDGSASLAGDRLSGKNNEPASIPHSDPAAVDKLSVTWISPVGYDEVFNVGCQTVHLEVTVQGPEEVTRVRFYYWDYVKERFVDITNVFQPPYEIDFYTCQLNPKWNQIFAKAFADNGGDSERMHIWLYKNVVYFPLIAKQYPTLLTLEKQVFNNNGGTALPSAWTLSASGPTSISGPGGIGPSVVEPGTYTLSESPGPGGYTAGNWVCDGGSQNGNQVTLSGGDNVTCTITNDDNPATLNVVKNLINDNGGSLTESDFEFSVNGGPATSFEVDGQNDLTVNAGTYTVLETAVAGYATTYSNCINVVIPIGGSATCTITNNDIPGSMTLVKTLLSNADEDGSGDISKNDTLTYQFVATNNGIVTLTNVTIVDSLPGMSALGCDQTQPATLAPQASLTCTATYVVKQPDVNAGSISNTATANSNQTDAVIDTLITPITQTNDLSVVKGSTTTLVTLAGQVVPYTYTVTNTGNTSLTNVTLSDNNVDLQPSCTPTTPATLDPAAVMNCTAQHTVTQDEINAGGNLTNIATADSDQTLPVIDQLDIPISSSPSMSLVKGSTTTLVTLADQVVLYTYTVTNTGNTTLTNVTLSDDNVDSQPGCTPTTPATLAPAAVMNCTAQHTVTQDEINAGGNLTNIATADSDQTLQVIDQLEIPINSTSSMNLVKDSTITLVTSAGQVVPYTYQVTNNGNTTLTNVTLSDNNVNSQPGCTPTTPATLAPAAVMNCTAQHTVTQDEMNTGGNLTNTATADSNQTAPTNDILNIPISQNPNLTLVKDSITTEVNAVDQVVPYTYQVTNNGNITLTGVTLSDDNVDSQPNCTPSTPATLTPAAEMNCSAQHTVTQDDMDAGGNLTNTATADSNQTVQVEDTLNIPVTQSPSMTIAKSSITSEVTEAGQVVPYSYLVANTGDVTLSGITVSDDNVDAPPICSDTTLAPSTNTTCTAQYTVTQGDISSGGDLTNNASVSSNETGADADTDSLNIPINPPASPIFGINPSITEMIRVNLGLLTSIWYKVLG